MAGYHLTEPKRGVFGELSKVYEEIDELHDAEEQGATLMLIQELSDVIGAIEGYLKHHPSITLDDLIKMKNITKRAFKSGARTIELGSYGVRRAFFGTWVYGTGIAEPRFSKALTAHSF